MLKRYCDLFHTLAVFCFVFFSDASVRAVSRDAINDARTNHIILLDSEGRLRTPVVGYRHPPLNNSQACATYISNLVDHALAERETNGSPRLLLFFHGGMKNWDGTLEEFDSHWQEIKANDYYPIFVIWPSDFFGSYWESLSSIRQGEKFRLWLGVPGIPFVFVADLGRAVTRAPVVWGNLLRNDLSETPVFNWSSADRFRSANGHYNMLRSKTPKTAISIESDCRTGCQEMGRFVCWILTLPLKLATSPIIDAFGKSAWENMLRRTQTVFPGQRIAASTDGQGLVKVRTDPNVLGLQLFMRDLSQLTNQYSLTAIGHSMGTIILNRVLHESPLNFTKIVYMAAACSVNDFKLSGLPYIAAHPETKFYDLMLHPVAESRETTVFDIPPRGSLLQWIDNFISTPLTIEDRTLGKWDNLLRTGLHGDFVIDQLLAECPTNQLFFRAFACAPGNGNDQTGGAVWNRQWTSVARLDPLLTDWNPQTHGSFNSPKDWKAGNWMPR